LSVQLWDAVQGGRHEEALDLHERILRVWRSIEGPNSPTLLKGALELQGRNAGFPRHPFPKATAEQLAPIREALIAAGVEVVA
jgi:4-hydroxy-tetrahydrodipicolinate synthase